MSRPREVVLKPGEFHFSRSDCRIRTLLGSCVSITLWHPKLRAGGMCHYMLAGDRERLAGPPGCPGDHQCSLDGRYAEDAMALFLRELELLGTAPMEYEARMFGGANQFPDRVPPPPLDISRQNVAAGFRLLARHGFALLARHVGGTGYRRLSLDVDTGAVEVTHIDHADLRSAS